MLQRQLTEISKENEFLFISWVKPPAPEPGLLKSPSPEKPLLDLSEGVGIKDPEQLEAPISEKPRSEAKRSQKMDR